MRTIFKLGLFSVWMVFGSLTALANTTQSFDLYIRGASLIDPATESVVVGDIGIRAGKIAAIYTLNSRPSQVDAKEVVQAEGKWIVPGLHDLHVHPYRGNISPGEGYAPIYNDVADAEMVGQRLLFAGITTYLNLASPSRYGDNWDGSSTFEAFDFRAHQRAGAFLNPNVFVAGPAWAVPGSHSAMIPRPNVFHKILVKDDSGNSLPEAEVIAKVRAAVESFISSAHPDVIKFIYNNHADLPSNRPEVMPLYVAKTIIDTANRHGVKTVAHLGTWKAVKELADAGISAVTHLPHGTPPMDVVATLKANGTAVITTISVYDDLGDMKIPERALSYVENPLLKLLTPLPFAMTLLDYSKYSADDQKWADWGALHSAIRDQQNAVAGLAAGGVTILPGTDAPFTGAIFGYSLHRELQQWQNSGIRQWDILKGATSNASRFLGERGGALAVGLQADLIVLRADPLADISNTQLIDDVIMNGSRVNRDQLQKSMVKSNWAH